MIYLFNAFHLKHDIKIMNKYNKYRALEDHCTDGKHIEAIQYKDILKSKKKINQSINQSNVKYQLERAVCD